MQQEESYLLITLGGVLLAFAAQMATLPHKKSSSNERESGEELVVQEGNNWGYVASEVVYTPPISVANDKPTLGLRRG